MDPLPKNEGVIYMDPLPPSEGIIYMTPKTPLVPGGDIYVEDITWVLWKSNEYWDGAWTSWAWNSTPGDNMWAGGRITVPAGYNYIKIEYIADYWTQSAPGGGANMYTLGIKGYINSGGFESVIEVDATREIRVGNYDPGTGSNQIHYKIWLAT